MFRVKMRDVGFQGCLGSRLELGDISRIEFFAYGV